MKKYFFFFVMSFVWGITIHIPDDFPTIEEGIDASQDGDIVLVAPGVYTGDGNTELSFDGKAIAVVSQAGPEETIIDCEERSRGCRGFKFDSGENSQSILDGFTIRNGFRSAGAGIYIEESSPTIRNCIITNCTADDGGGGMYIRSDLIQIKQTMFDGNTAVLGGICDDSS